MKKLLVLFTLMLGFGISGWVAAQPPKGKQHMRMGIQGHPGMEKPSKMTPEERAQKMTDRMSEELLLSKEQKAKVYQINLETAQKNEVQRKEAELIKEKMRLIQQDRMKAIEQVLTTEQIKLLEKKQDERQAIMEQRREEMREKYRERTREK
jgi:periplasmic protein CpxP/Spy